MREKIIEMFLSLNKEDREALLKELRIVSFELPHSEVKVNSCPHCQGVSVMKYGTHNGEQRYMCRSCKRTFNITTGTAIGMIKKKGAFLACQDMMITDGYMPLNKLANKLNISIPTAFDWRHKILLALPESSSKFEGETQIDDLWFLYSQKGRKGLEHSRKRGGAKQRGDNEYQVKVLAATNKEQLELKVAKIGRISEADIQRTMGDKFNKKTILISDKHKSISAFANKAKLGHISFKASEHTTTDGKGVQLVNNIAERLKATVNRTFHGVSTKYLQMYANWFKVMENNKSRNADQEFYLKTMLANKKTWDVYTNIEKVYAQFITNHSARTYQCPIVSHVKAVNWNQKVILDNHYI